MPLIGARRALLRSPALWTPLNLGSALVAWWDASDTAHMTFNSGNVASWTDKVGGIVASQATGANQPGYSATARNGKPGVTFSGSNAVVLSATLAGILPQGGADSTIAAAGYGTGSAETNGTFFSFGSASVNSARIVGHNNSGSSVWLSSISSDYSPAVSWSALDRFVIWQHVAANAKELVNADGVQYSNGSLLSVNTSATGTINIGKYPSATVSLAGIVQQIQVCNRGLSNSELQKLEGWESWYDGKAGSNLPAGHPYKYRAPYVSDP